jgi:hypothetical protein
VTQPLQELYEARFDAHDVKAKQAIWKEITQFLQRFVDPAGPVLDLACDRGDFIRAIRASERWATDIRDMRSALPDGIQFVQSSGQPNIRLVGPRYWDFIDHKVALTERSLTEAAELAGLRTERVITRFLPDSTKGRRPSAAWLVRAYLAFSPAWWLLGKQTLYVGSRP